MSRAKAKKRGEYEVGYGKPPKAHRFKKGTSGNPRGAPSKQTTMSADVAAILTEPMTVKSGGARRNMMAFEVGVRKIVEKALKHDDLSALLEFLKLCEEYKVLVPPPPPTRGGVVVAPKHVNFQEWVDSVTEPIPPSDGDEETFA